MRNQGVFIVCTLVVLLGVCTAFSVMHPNPLPGKVVTPPEPPGVMTAERVANVLRVTTYPIVAIDPLYREKVIEILKTNIEQVVKEE